MRSDVAGTAAFDVQLSRVTAGGTFYAQALFRDQASSAGWNSSDLLMGTAQ